MKMHSLVAAAALACASVPVCAQPSAQEARPGVAQLKEVHGNVLVSRESGLGAGRDGVRLAPGVRVITTSKSDATVVYDDGCEVKLKENERFEVVVGKSCEVLASAPQSILATPAGATVATAATAAAAATAAGSAAAFAVTLPAIGGAAAGYEAFTTWRRNDPVSPS